MPPDSIDSAQPPASTGALLEQKLVGDITGRFFVAQYQRGYRWGEQEVKALLDDIHLNGSKAYSLQPVVVKLRAGELGSTPDDEIEWELVDGQQRLTTLYLIFLYMQRAQLKNVPPPYAISFETRPGSADYLQTLNPAKSRDYIDFHHLFTAYQCIQAWFERFPAGAKRQFQADEFYGALFKYVRVIWYQAPAEMDAITLFTRLNVGRIPLTDAELVKALLLSRSRKGATSTDRAPEVAAYWDAIERDLRKPDLWAFVTTALPAEYPTHITLLLDALAGEPPGGKRPPYFTFDRLRERMGRSSWETLWQEIVDLHALILGWFENRDHYHKIGFLVNVGMDFAGLAKLALDKTRSEFETQLDQRITDRLNIRRSQIDELGFQNDRDACHRLLLLMNVETVRRIKDSTERYPFRAHGRAGRWSLEHIHAQQADTLNKQDQWKEWLRLHRDALAVLPVDDPAGRDALVHTINDSIESIDGRKFDDLAPRVTRYFGAKEPGQAAEWMHSISNLALLPMAENSALSNAVFEVKRQRILKMDRAGAYIPICTRHVFLKYYSGANAQQIHFWGPQDRESYLNAMISEKEGMITRYLQPDKMTP